MATLSRRTVTPLAHLSTRCAPRVLGTALTIIFTAVPEAVWLVGGTALAGYYAAHRRSDDLDLFAKDAPAFRATVAAVRSLTRQGAVLEQERHFPEYFHVDVAWQQHQFTIDVVQDARLHAIGTARRAADGVWVPDLPTLYLMKIAALVSRCSEKDLYDLAWLFAHHTKIDVGEMLAKGQLLDAGLTVESLLISLRGTVLRRDACGFVMGGPSKMAAAHRTITALQRQLVKALLAHEKTSAPSELVSRFRQQLRK